MCKRYRHIHFVGVDVIGMSGTVDIRIRVGGSALVVTMLATGVRLDISRHADV
ncbi:MAG: hypothetical protein HYU41_20195 [Candidatus Rokubacteria bacterium]|nr:hypothetical protein [Candidatus Rokubacteria bacterium]